MIPRRNIVAALGIGLASLLGYTAPCSAQQNPVTAIDIVLEPDATMIQHAKAANARLLKAYPKGFTLDATHQPHITMIQQFVRTADLDKIYAAAQGSGQSQADKLEVEGLMVRSARNLRL